MKVIVIGQARAKAGQEEKVKDGLLHLAALTRSEPGCINYDIHQSADDPALFLSHETWESREACEAHMKQPTVAALLAKSDELFDGPVTIKLWQKIS